MTPANENYVVSADVARLNVEWIVDTLRDTYWARSRAPEVIRQSMEGSLCFGMYEAGTGVQVGFGRIVTDRATFAWICDVVIDPARRGCGLGKRLLEEMMADPRLSGVTFRLATQDAHGFYERYGFVREEIMRRAKKA